MGQGAKHRISLGEFSDNMAVVAAPLTTVLEQPEGKETCLVWSHSSLGLDFYLEVHHESL